MAQGSSQKIEKDESVKEPAEQMPKDLKVWIDKKLSMLTMDGEKVYYPEKISLGKELLLRNLLSDKLSTIVSMFSDLEEGGELPEGAFSFFFKDFYELLPSMISIVISSKGTQRNEEWVKENLDGDTCQEIIAPFFGNLLRMQPMQMMDMGTMKKMVAPKAGGKGKQRKLQSPK